MEAWVARMSRAVAFLAVVLAIGAGGGAVRAITAPPTMPIAQYREEHRTALFTLDTRDATWHATGQYFPSLQLCFEFADDLDARATTTVVYDCRWAG
jgi:hypothetical protein